MRCSKCGCNLGLNVRFCPKCGVAVSPNQKKKSLIALMIWLLIFLILIPTIYFLSLKYGQNETQNNFYIFLGSFVAALLMTLSLFLIYSLIAAIIRFIIWQPVIASIIVGVFLVIIGFGTYTYLSATYLSVKNKVTFSSSLSLIQDNLAEVTAVKIMGDSMGNKKPLVGASWDRVNIISQMVSGRLKTLKVPKELQEYENAAIAWSDAITTASKNPDTWKTVPDDPGNVTLELSNDQAQQLFEASTNKIAELKGFGDEAIRMKNQSSLLYIGAKLKVQRHFLNILGNSSTENGSVSFHVINSVFASYANPMEVPPVGPGTDVTCQVCNDPKVTMTVNQRQSMCSRCNPQQKTQTPPQQKTQTPPPQKQQNQQPELPKIKTPPPIVEQTPPPVPPKKKTTPPKKQIEDNPSNNSDQNNTENNTPVQPLPRKICIGRGGTSNGTGEPTNVYCVEDVLQSTNGIDASAIQLAEGNTNAKTDWDNGWHNLEGMGVISQGEPTTTSGHTPEVQVFYDACTAKGGIVGGAGIPKTRLPTTEFGYTCEYKTKNNGSDIPCWDFLTYSGGKYMGGNPGCEEQNLLPNVAEEQAKALTSGGKWDGHYTGSVTANCTTTIPDLPAISKTIAMDFTVHNNVTFDQPVNTYVSIDNNGNAIESVQQSMGNENATVYVYATFYYHFSDTGVSASGSMDMNAVREDGVFSGSCTVTGGAGKK